MYQYQYNKKYQYKPMCRNKFNSMCPQCKKNNENRLQVALLVEDKQYVKAFRALYIFKQYPKKYPCNKKLLTAKYEVKLKAFALNELLDRPVPYVVYLGAELAAAKYGKFERLDATLGIDSSKSDEDDELMKELERQVKMNDIMINILKARGLDFDEIIAVAAKMKLEIVNNNAKLHQKKRRNKSER